MPHRVRFADFGATVDALDRPATAPDAVTLGHAYKIPGRG